MAGLQHIADNLCSDVHKSLKHWDAFYQQLKTFESLLRLEETLPPESPDEGRPETREASSSFNGWADVCIRLGSFRF